MEQFIAVAIAHFLALLIPGVDFFLIARMAATSGWRNASGVCLGIASANGMFIVAAFSGLSFITNTTVLAMVQLAGGAFLIYIGVAFIRSNTRFTRAKIIPVVETTWLKSFGLGAASGLLNPKNALFYLSLASVLSGAPTLTLFAYGAWMVTIVFAWDLCVALALGSHRALTKLERIVPWLTKAAGGFLVVFGIGMIASIALQLLR